MITSAKSNTKKNNNNKTADRENPRTNGKSKAIQTKAHKQAYRCTLTKGEKGKKYIYRFCFFLFLFL